MDSDVNLCINPDCWALQVHFIYIIIIIHCLAALYFMWPKELSTHRIPDVAAAIGLQLYEAFLLDAIGHACVTRTDPQPLILMIVFNLLANLWTIYNRVNTSFWYLLAVMAVVTEVVCNGMLDLHLPWQSTVLALLSAFHDKRPRNSNEAPVQSETKFKSSSKSIPSEWIKSKEETQ